MPSLKKTMRKLWVKHCHCYGQHWRGYVKYCWKTRTRTHTHTHTHTHTIGVTVDKFKGNYVEVVNETLSLLDSLPESWIPIYRAWQRTVWPTEVTRASVLWLQGRQRRPALDLRVKRRRRRRRNKHCWFHRWGHLMGKTNHCKMKHKSVFASAN